MKRIIVLGSTGSVGTQTLDVVSKIPNIIRVVGLSAQNNVELLKKQIVKFRPQVVCVGHYADAERLKAWLLQKKVKTGVYFGADGLEKLATLPAADMVVSAISGSIGLTPVIKAISAKKNIAIANKEALVMAGNKIMSLAAKNKIAILPIDSEHSAIFQCLCGENKKHIKKIILTASGGPFYKHAGNLSKITVEQALKHPTWKMGKKITIDCATLMNKGLEAIEASILFGVPIEKIEIVIHPQSIVHSMVEFTDGSVIAQMSNPNMKLPIQYALTYPSRKYCPIKPLNLPTIGKLEFYNADFAKFPALSLAYKAAQKGGTMPAVMSAANEIAVTAFLNKEIKLTHIAKIVAKTMKAHKVRKNPSIDEIIEADTWARQYVQRQLQNPNTAKRKL